MFDGPHPVCWTITGNDLTRDISNIIYNHVGFWIVKEVPYTSECCAYADLGVVPERISGRYFIQSQAFELVVRFFRLDTGRALGREN
jgi:hypothetical protein